MALVDCALCSKKISSKAKSCPHCKADFENLTQGQLDARRDIAKIKRSQSLMTQSFVAMLLFCTGVLMYFLGDHETYIWMPLAGQIVGVTGLVWYLSMRIFMVVQKVKSKS
ncbi:zinc ribbon domain-containing protein [Neiella marina]|uniref:Zinc ribbon domain-containing protein n=1 Tax=Neiella holothuriorum TaxID=2870530 RepID=A0ABS7EEB8_9GAMM|nr:zinc ribbon domain-containing protein [Neiella holothuriorum]MBW8190689.1 zinc ribbon domain-containing protein [Neiella holothuriorum]